MARPNVFVFGDVRFNKSRADEQLGRFVRWLEELRGRGLVVVECGAGTAVPTIRLKCQDIAGELKGQLIRINLLEPHGPATAISIPLGAREALEAIAVCCRRSAT